MGLVTNTVYKKFKKIGDKPELICNEEFMMGMSQYLEEDIEEFKKYNEYLYRQKKSMFISCTGSKVVSYKLLGEKLYSIQQTKTTKQQCLLWRYYEK